MFVQARSSRDFTLIELLVVVAIIAVLASLLLPGLVAARETAIRADCTNRMRQTMIAEALYEDSYQCILPNTIGLGDKWKGEMEGWQLLYEAGILNRAHVMVGNDWNKMTESMVGPIRAESPLLCSTGERVNHLSSFMKYTALADDPAWDKEEGFAKWSVAGHDPDWFTDPWPTVSTATIFYSYGIGYNMCTKEQLTSTAWYYRPIKSVDNPSSKVYMLESTINLWTPTHMQYEVGRSDMLGYGKRQFRMVHGNYHNYACVDGHVGRITKQDFLRFDFNPTQALAALPFEY